MCASDLFKYTNENYKFDNFDTIITDSYIEKTISNAFYSELSFVTEVAGITDEEQKKGSFFNFDLRTSTMLLRQTFLFLATARILSIFRGVSSLISRERNHESAQT